MKSHEIFFASNFPIIDEGEVDQDRVVNAVVIPMIQWNQPMHERF